MPVATFALPGHTARRFAAPVCLRTTSGMLWVTVDGDPEDILLAAGEARRFERGRSVVVYALGGDAGVEVTTKQPPAVRVRRLAEQVVRRVAVWWNGGPVTVRRGV